jgi:hypothetical protein
LYKKIILFSIESSILNAKVIFDERFGEKSSVKEFKERIIQYIFEEYNVCKNKNNIIQEEDETNNNSNFIPIKYRNLLHHLIHIFKANNHCKYCT